MKNKRILFVVLVIAVVISALLSQLIMPTNVEGPVVLPTSEWEWNYATPTLAPLVILFPTLTPTPASPTPGYYTYQSIGFPTPKVEQGFSLKPLDQILWLERVWGKCDPGGLSFGRYGYVQSIGEKIEITQSEEGLDGTYDRFTLYKRGAIYIYAFRNGCEDLALGWEREADFSQFQKYNILIQYLDGNPLAIYRQPVTCPWWKDDPDLVSFVVDNQSDEPVSVWMITNARGSEYPTPWSWDQVSAPIQPGERICASGSPSWAYKGGTDHFFMVKYDLESGPLGLQENITPIKPGETFEIILTKRQN